MRGHVTRRLGSLDALLATFAVTLVWLGASSQGRCTFGDDELRCDTIGRVVQVAAVGLAVLWLAVLGALVLQGVRALAARGRRR